MPAKRLKVEWAMLSSVVIAAVIAISAVVVAGVAAEAGGSSRLVSVQHLPESMDMCAWNESTGADRNVASPKEKILFSALQMDPSSVLMAELQQNGVNFVPPQTERQEREAAELRAHGARTPLRTIRDTAPSYSAVAVDVNSDEVILQDNNLWSYRVFDRISKTPPDGEITKPKRIVRGNKTALQFNNGLYVDPVNGDIFSVESDTGDKMVRFPREANGEV